MVSLQNMTRKNGTAYVQVLYRLNGKQTSTSFDDAASAEKFRDLVDAVGHVQGLASVAADPALSTMTVEQWVAHYIEHRTALAKSTLADYHSYAKRDINPTLGPIPLKALSRDDCRHTCASWLIAAGFRWPPSISISVMRRSIRPWASTSTSTAQACRPSRTRWTSCWATDYKFWLRSTIGFGARRIGHDPGHF